MAHIPKKIIYIGQMLNFSTCAARMRSLQELGCVTVPFDMSPYTAYPRRAFRTLAHRTNFGPPVNALNRDVVQFVEINSADVTHVWIDKGKWLYPETIQAMQQVTGASVIHYTPDSHFFANISRHFFASIPFYDLLFTTKKFEVDLYRKRGARRVHFIDQGYDGTHLFPRDLSHEERRRFGSDLCFAGRCEPHYVKSLKTAFQVAGRHRVWGPGWRRYTRLHPWIHTAFSGDGVWGDDYARAIKGAAIALCLLTKQNGNDTTTTRTFEIPGCGGFMLAERTEDHLALFEEGKEAEFFGGPEELIEKIRYYLRHPDDRKRIATAGHQRCITGGYSNHHRAMQMLEVIDELRPPPTQEDN